MIKTLSLKFGRAPGLSPETIPPEPVTVFVGPNNSGKSKILDEIHRYCTHGGGDVSDVIVEQIGFESFSQESAEERINHMTLPPDADERLELGQLIVGKRGIRRHVLREDFIASFLDPDAHARTFCRDYLIYHILMLDGISRITLINDQEGGDLQQAPQTSFQVLLQDKEKRAEVRRIVHEAVGKYLVVDPTHLGKLRLRLSSTEPASELQEIGIDEEARQFHKAAQLIGEMSDGVKAFTGIITEIIAGDPSLLLIDEPEAFLHPALSFNLGKEIARASSDSEKRLFVSTHSPHFVMGCIQSGVPTNIVRLTYRDDVATARILDSQELLPLMRNPLLRSTRVLDGLFYEYVVVTEGDTDRAFYQEVNERLLRFKPEWGIPNCLFLNAQNKQTVHTMLKPLRRLGIPAAGIVDVDILRDVGKNWTDFLEGGCVPKLGRDALAVSRNSVKCKLEATGKEMKRAGGLDLLNESDKEAAQNLCGQLREYGLFIVEKGELESWLPELEVSSRKSNWLIEVFQKMGEDPDREPYVRPGSDGVWAFLKQVKLWLSDSERKGIPP